ncbi:hypothetical protein F5B21DRAFT_506276 [Xylaria acuta]|nr:hypothetical protein F5B21DRAFT_506276 [Xylaria acuta]
MLGSLTSAPQFDHSFYYFPYSLVEVVKLVNESERRMSILFVNSLFLVGNMAMSTATTVREAPIQDFLAAERVLTGANEKCGVPDYAARVCQLKGQNADFASSGQSWLFAIIRTAKTLNSIPMGVAIVDWLHVDVAARMLADILT